MIELRNKNMKISILFVLLASSVCTFGQIVVSEPQIVADQATYGNLRPRVVTDMNNNPVIVWADLVSHHIYATHLMGDSFMQPVQLNPDESNAAVYDWYGPDIAIYGNDVYVVYKELPESSGDIFLVHSSNGGMSWGSPMLVSNSDDPAVRMPDVAVGNDGTVYVAYMYEYYDTMATEWVVTKSENQGQSFSPAVSATSSLAVNVCDCCPAELLIHEEYVTVVYRNNDDNLRDIRAAVSQDGGATFDIFIDLDPLNWELDACPASGPNAIVDANGIQSVWMSDATGDSRVYYSTHGFGPGADSPIIGLHNTQVTEVQNYPTLAAEEFWGLVAWEVNDSGQKDIAMTWTAGGFTVQEYMLLTSDESGHQQRPHLASAGGSLFHLVYSDNGGDAVIYRSIDILNSVPEQSNAIEAAVFPNPFQDNTQIQFANGKKVNGYYTLFDMQGRTLSNVTYFSNTDLLNLNMEDLSDGVYMLQIVMGDKVVKLPLLKK
jgi:hypothetical protein